MIAQESLAVLAEEDVQLLTSIQARLEIAQRAAQNIIIDDEKKAKEATASLALARKSRKQLERRRLELTRPLDQQKNTIALPFRDLEASLKTLDGILEPKIGRWHDEIEARRKAEVEELRQQELVALRKKRDEQLEQAEINESALALEDAVATQDQIEEIEFAKPTIDSKVATRTIVGSSHRRRPWTYRVISLGKVPRKLLATLNEKGQLESGHSLVMATIKAGARDISGIEIYQKTTISIR